jgi:magnesium transporter
MSLSAYYLRPDGTVQSDLSKKQIKDAYESCEGLLWVDIEETTEEDGRFLEHDLRFHHLAVEDCVSPLIHSPKIDDFGDYVFITAHGINHVAEADIVETAELALFLGPSFVVSNHNTPLYCVEAVRQMVETDGRPMKRGADFLAHALMDVLIDNVMPTIDKMSDFAEEIEEEVIRNPHQAVLGAIMKLKRSTLGIRRAIAPQRDILNRISRGDYSIVKEEARIFYRDIYDHLIRIEDLNQAIRERADNALTTYLSSVANRQNEVMKVLSVVAAIFLPLTLVAGIYGMNFDYMPELRVHWAYFAVLGFMGAVIAGVVWWFWAKKWFNWGRRRFIRANPFLVEGEKLKGYLTRLTKRSAGQ